MSKKPKGDQEPIWFENQQEITGIVTQLKKHYYDYKLLSGAFQVKPYEVDYDKLLTASGGNQQLVDAVRKYVTECYFDKEGNPKEYGGFERIRIAHYRKREEAIPDPNSKDWIHVVFDHGYSVKMIAGPIGHDYVLADFGMNKAFLYSLSKML